ncbi:hypothetical protein OG2516_03855 [Oceanicola granulosus HTCC2516]|uniref:Uncharacterized protein n=1 Tax=Oceanicola granulosus (strain ATCC BAA-861 / DSM 15982 / KCTC 12143 / HTCC2516) TaxID=314256 RepID=Q2CG40_OCEGH|nr:hypothetical protein [Oceanicola granulosus]EAR51689.1 hypothetical protein OG2516_03855 [Oceanicola granulosus HTCC2516]
MPAAVLTGDLVASRAADAASTDAAMARLAEAADAFGREVGHDLRFTRFRGDGWQVLVPDAALALDATLAMLAGLAGAELATRIAIGIGAVDHPGSRDLADAAGSAFVASGDALESLPRRNRLAIAGDDVAPWQAGALDLIEHIATGWSAAQAEAAAYVLRPNPLTQDEIAARLGITRQAVQSRLAAAGAGHFERILAAFRAHAYA